MFMAKLESYLQGALKTDGLQRCPVVRSIFFFFSFKKKFPSKNIMKFSGKIKSIWGNQQPFQEQIQNPQSSPTSFIMRIATDD